MNEPDKNFKNFVESFLADAYNWSCEVGKSSDKRKEMNLCFEARKSFGGKGLTLEKFGQRTGRSVSMIHRREKGELGIPGTAKVLYRLIYLMGRCGLGDLVMRTSDLIPEGDISEERLLTDLTMACVEAGKKDIVRLSTKEIDPSEVDLSQLKGDYDSTPDAIRYVQIMRLDFEDLAKRKPHLRKSFLESAGKLAEIEYNLRASMDPEAEGKEDT